MLSVKTSLELEVRMRADPRDEGAKNLASDVSDGCERVHTLTLPSHCFPRREAQDANGSRLRRKLVMPGISVAVMIVIAAFAIERVVGALLFLLSYVPRWREFLPDARLAADQERQIELEQRHKLVSISIAGALALAIVWMVPIEALGYLGVAGVSSEVDRIFTAVVLVAGSDQIRALIKGGEGGSAARAPEPIHVTGSLVLRESSESKSKPA
jgi:hypothetical protein